MGGAKARNIFNYEASLFQRAAQFGIWFSAIDSMNYPFNLIQPTPLSISFRQSRDCRQNAFTAAFNLR